MTDFFKTARNKNRFRAACKEFNVAQLETMAKHLSEFIEKRSKEEAVLAQQSAQKAVEREAILAAIADAGLTPADFFSAGTSKKVKTSRKPVAPQYRIIDSQGTQHQWSGRGRTPKSFQQYFNNGGTKDTCRI